MPKANSSSSYTSPHPPIPLPDHHNHPVTRRSFTTSNEGASSLPPPANAVSSNNHTEHDNDDNQNKQIISLPFNWQVKKKHNYIFITFLNNSYFSRLQNFLLMIVYLHYV
jgi:hypothetical protein